MAGVAVLGRGQTRRSETLQDPDQFGVFCFWGLKKRNPEIAYLGASIPFQKVCGLAGRGRNDIDTTAMNNFD